MSSALAAATDHEPSATVQQKLLDLWPSHVETLQQALEARMRERTAGLQKALADRAEKEATDIRTILTELQKAIQDQLTDPFFAQGFLPGLAPTEREQFERNMDALRARVQTIPEEMERETAAIKARFADPQPRMFPVAVTYLIPEKLARG
jgi:hypothetical protein